MFIFLRQMNEVQTLLPYFFEAYFNVSFLFTPSLGIVTFLEFINLIYYGVILPLCQ
jgi:hypothetical protein